MACEHEANLAQSCGEYGESTRSVVVEKTIQVPKAQIEEKTIMVPKGIPAVVGIVVQHQIQLTEVVKPTTVHKIMQHKRPILQQQVAQKPVGVP